MEVKQVLVEWHLREEDYASLFEEYLTPDPVESFLNEIPIIHLEARSDLAACNMDYYPMDAALGTHEVFEFNICHRHGVFGNPAGSVAPITVRRQCYSEYVL